MLSALNLYRSYVCHQLFLSVHMCHSPLEYDKQCFLESSPTIGNFSIWTFSSLKPNKHFLPQSDFVYGIYHSNGNQTKVSMIRHSSQSLTLIITIWWTVTLTVLSGICCFYFHAYIRSYIKWPQVYVLSIINDGAVDSDPVRWSNHYKGIFVTYRWNILKYNNFSKANGGK